MSEKTARLADAADEANLECGQFHQRWQGAAAACARVRAAAPGPLPAWLAAELEDIPEEAFQAYQAAMRAANAAAAAYIAACREDRQAASRA